MSHPSGHTRALLCSALLCAARLGASSRLCSIDLSIGSVPASYRRTPAQKSREEEHRVVSCGSSTGAHVCSSRKSARPLTQSQAVLLLGNGRKAGTHVSKQMYEESYHYNPIPSNVYCRGCCSKQRTTPPLCWLGCDAIIHALPSTRSASDTLGTSTSQKTLRSSIGRRNLSEPLKPRRFCSRRSSVEAPVSMLCQRNFFQVSAEHRQLCELDRWKRKPQTPGPPLSSHLSPPK